MRSLFERFDRLDTGLNRWLVAHSIALLRINLGIIFLAFGALKFFPGMSPIEDLATRTTTALTFGLVQPGEGLVIIAALECAIGLCFVNYCHQAEPEAACHSKFRPLRKERRMCPTPTTDDISSVYPVTTRYTGELLGRLTQGANLSLFSRGDPGRESTPYAALTDAADYSDMCLLSELFSCPYPTTKGYIYGRNSVSRLAPVPKGTGFRPVCFVTGRFLRVGVWLMGAQMLGAMSPLVLFPGELFSGFLHAPTLAAQYIIKDVVLVAAAMVIASTWTGARIVAEPTSLKSSVSAGAPRVSKPAQPEMEPAGRSARSGAR